jgi:hypothetical protein
MLIINKIKVACVQLYPTYSISINNDITKTFKNTYDKIFIIETRITVFKCDEL